MAGLFAKAAKAKSAEAPAKVKKSTTWVAGDPTGNAVAGAVHELVTLSAQAKAIEAKMGVHKTIVKKYAEDKFLEHFADVGVSPETPMVVQNSDGEKVTFVVQDRSSQYNVKPEQVTALTQLLGEDAANALLYEETTFSFSRDILALPGVMAVVEKALEGAVKELTGGKKPVLSSDDAERLLDVETKTAFKPGTVDRISLICGKDTGKMKQFLEAMGSSCCRYVKP